MSDIWINTAMVVVRVGYVATLLLKLRRRQRSRSRLDV